MTPSLYRQLLGADYALLSPAQQRFHDLQGRHVLHGEADVRCGRHPLAGLVARVMGLPTRDARVPLRFELEVTDEKEVWSRHFGAQGMRSVLRGRSGRIVEQLGAMVLESTLSVDGDWLKMRVHRARLLGLLPMPLRLMPEVKADETGDAQRVRFDIRVAWSWLGLLVAYEGYLEIPEASDEHRGL